MTEHRTLQRLRSFLRGLAAALFGGTLAELLLARHTDGLLQLVPFALAALGLVALTAAWLRPSRRTVRVLRMVMPVVAAGGPLGIALHFWGNLDFARETRPGADAASLLLAALTGRDPLLAPGILAVAAAVALAATYEAGDQETVDSTSRARGVVRTEG